MSLGVMRQAVCRDSFTMDSLAIYHDDPLTITAADLLDDFQAIETSPDLTLDEYFSSDFDFSSSYSTAPMSPIEGVSIDSMFHLHTIETTAIPTASGLVESHTSKYDITYSTQTSPVTPSHKIKTGLLTPLTTSLSFFDDPDETDGESQNETSVNPAVLRKKTKRVKVPSKIQKPKKPQHTRTPSKPKAPKAGSWNVRLGVHMSHSESGHLVVSNSDKLPAHESHAGGICPTPKQMSLDRLSVGDATSLVDQLELMEYQLMDPKQLL